ncbi:esterase 1 [Mycena maculata]|uniref:Esterase 1 n=1 Tax=Mycena maculata TaxID=230809 RepID=A0AAD7JJH7_9AGAR|nr:esterase 1 [Mycena maculata]
MPPATVLFFLLSLVSVGSATPQLEVQLGNTTVIGTTSGSCVEFFGGIPFAEPPTGAQRLNTPVLKTQLPSGEFDATNFGPFCLQPGIPPDLVSEDCLTLNIFRPCGLSSDASLPVLFWTYGGGFTGGGSPQYNASAIVTQSMARGTPIVYVSWNYRLGPLGFPQGSEASENGILNLGLQDQLACLEWVQHCIKAFGGDPSRVTMSGQSSGAIMTSILLFWPNITNLARAAIFESGSAASAGVFTADERGEIDWQNFVGGVPACNGTQNTNDTLACLRSVGSADILTGWSAASSQTEFMFPWIPVVDGCFLSTLPSILWSNGNFSRLPCITGTVLDEGTLFTGNYSFADSMISNFIIANFSPPFMQTSSTSDLQAAAQTILQLYPNDPTLGSPFDTGNDTFGLSVPYKRVAAIEGDISFQSQRRLWAQTAAAQNVSVYVYMFTQPQSQAPPSLGVYHGSDVPFVYGAAGPVGSSNGNLSGMMMDYWVSFVSSLDPNDGLGAPRPTWSAYTSASQSLMQLNGDNTTMIPDDYRQDQIQYIVNNSATFHH